MAKQNRHFSNPVSKFSPPSPPKSSIKKDEYGFPLTYEDEELAEAYSPSSEDQNVMQSYSKPKPEEEDLLDQIEREQGLNQTQPQPKLQTPTPAKPQQEKPVVAQQISQKEAVRLALEHNPNFTAKQAVPWILENYGDQLAKGISEGNFSNLKSVLKREVESEGGVSSAPAQSRTPTPRPAAAQPNLARSTPTAPKPTQAGTPLETIRTIKNLLATNSPEDLVELIQVLSE